MKNIKDHCRILRMNSPNTNVQVKFLRRGFLNYQNHSNFQLYNFSDLIYYSIICNNN